MCSRSAFSVCVHPIFLVLVTPLKVSGNRLISMLPSLVYTRRLLGRVFVHCILFQQLLPNAKFTARHRTWDDMEQRCLGGCGRQGRHVHVVVKMLVEGLAKEGGSSRLLVLTDVSVSFG